MRQSTLQKIHLLDLKAIMISENAHQSHWADLFAWWQLCSVWNPVIWQKSRLVRTRLAAPVISLVFGLKRERLWPKFRSWFGPRRKLIVRAVVSIQWGFSDPLKISSNAKNLRTRLKRSMSELKIIISTQDSLWLQEFYRRFLLTNQCHKQLPSF